MNLYLEWDTGSDLDIQVYCGCGKWHGYGTDGGSGGSCRCDTCDMKRDHDMRNGQDKERAIDTNLADESNPPRAFEHVYFKDPEELFGDRNEVKLGMGSYNYSQSSSKPRNDFRMAFFNKWGYQLYPNRGSTELKHEASWMFNTNVSGNKSEKKYFMLKRSDLNVGMELTSNSFVQHVHEVAKKQEDDKTPWEISEAEASMAMNDVKFENYRKAWDSQWARVKLILCGREHYDCEVLDEVHKI